MVDVPLVKQILVLLLSLVACLGRVRWKRECCLTGEEDGVPALKIFGADKMCPEC